MILIISNGQLEPPTDQVIDWLHYYNASYVRLNSEDLTDPDGLFSIGFDELIIGGQRIDIDEINVVWYRRWHQYEIGFRPSTKWRRQLIKEAEAECESILFYVYNVLKHKTWLCDPSVNMLHNKLYALYLAGRLNLKVPASLVTNDRKDLAGFLDACDGQIITKPMADPFPYFDSKGNNYNDYTEKVSHQLLETLPERMFPSLFQECVESELELRVFYLDGDFYSTALVNASTVDIKLSLAREAGLKFVCYDLPAELKEKLHRLMLELKLNTGSIDLLKTRSGEYIFLEVNPIGQFVGYGFPCNYYLDKKIAHWLSLKDHKKTDHEKRAAKVHDDL